MQEPHMRTEENISFYIISHSSSTFLFWMRELKTLFKIILYLLRMEEYRDTAKLKGMKS
jgi:hypothetical protein